MRELEHVFDVLEAVQPGGPSGGEPAGHILRLLGEPVWSRESGPQPIASKKGLALLCYLACQPRVEVSRRHLGSLLWGEFDKAQASASLATTLSRIRRQVPRWPLASQGEYLWWDPSQGVATDVSLFLDRQRSEAAPAQGAALVRGRFLAGLEFEDAPLYMDWLVAERQEWHRRSLDALWAAVLEDRSRSEWRAVLRWGRQALALDPLQERFVRIVMVAHAALGDRASCREAYDALAARLARQLNTRPDPDTIRLRNTLLRSPGASVSELGPAYQAGWGPEPQDAVPLVGRAAERRRLQEMVGPQYNHTATLVVGPMGVGKTRLLREALAGLDAVWADGRQAGGTADDQFPWSVWEHALHRRDPMMASQPGAPWRTLAASLPEGRRPVLVLDHAEALSLGQAAQLCQAVAEGVSEQIRLAVAVDPAQLDPDRRREWRRAIGGSVTVLALEPLDAGEVARLGEAAAAEPIEGALAERTGGLPLLVLAEVGGAAARARARERVAEWLAHRSPEMRALLEAAAASGAGGVPADRLWGSAPGMLDAMDRAVAAGWLLEAADGVGVWLRWRAPVLGELIREGMSLTRAAYWRAQISSRPHGA